MEQGTFIENSVKISTDHNVEKQIRTADPKRIFPSS